MKCFCNSLLKDNFVDIFALDVAQVGANVIGRLDAAHVGAIVIGHLDAAQVGANVIGRRLVIY